MNKTLEERRAGCASSAVSRAVPAPTRRVAATADVGSGAWGRAACAKHRPRGRSAKAARGPDQLLELPGDHIGADLSPGVLGEALADGDHLRLGGGIGAVDNPARSAALGPGLLAARRSRGGQPTSRPTGGCGPARRRSAPATRPPASFSLPPCAAPLLASTSQPGTSSIADRSSKAGRRLGRSSGNGTLSAPAPRAGTERCRFHGNGTLSVVT